MLQTYWGKPASNEEGIVQSERYSSAGVSECLCRHLHTRHPIQPFMHFTKLWNHFQLEASFWCFIHSIQNN